MPAAARRSGELKAAAALAERAVAAGARKRNSHYPYALFAEGLAAYRLGRFDDAIADDERRSRLGQPAPCPRLVIAMALFRKGESEQARKTPVGSDESFDWSRKISPDETGVHWVAQILRREAESLIQPQLPPDLRRHLPARPPSEATDPAARRS